MLNIVFVGLGGFIGAVSRYILSRFINNYFPNFPIGTLFVNIIGSFILGFILYSVAFSKNLSPELRNFAAIGLIGGFTTMSSFAYESFRLLEINQVLLFALNIIFNVLLSIAAVYAGKELAILISK
jgi:CrcB protein